MARAALGGLGVVLNAQWALRGFVLVLVSRVNMAIGFMNSHHLWLPAQRLSKINQSKL